MTCGRTCVATDVGGVTEARRRHRPGGAAAQPGADGAGLPHPAAGRPTCGAALGAAARTRALEHFTVDGAISAFDEIYSFLGAAPARCRSPHPVADAGDPHPATCCPGRPRDDRENCRALRRPGPRVLPVHTGRELARPPAEDATPRNVDGALRAVHRGVRVRGRPAGDLQCPRVRRPEATRRCGNVTACSDVFALAEEMYRRVPAAARRAGAAAPIRGRAASAGRRCTACCTGCPPSASPLPPGCWSALACSASWSWRCSPPGR